MQTKKENWKVKKLERRTEVLSLEMTMGTQEGQKAKAAEMEEKSTDELEDTLIEEMKYMDISRERERDRREQERQFLLQGLGEEDGGRADV